MKKFIGILSLPLLFATSLGMAQEEDTMDSIVLVGALTASISPDSIEFSNLPSGNVIRIGPDGVEVLSSATEVDPSVARLSGGGVSDLPPMERDALKRRLQRNLQQLFEAMDEEGSGVTEEDVSEIVKFLLSVDLPWDETFLDMIEQNLGEEAFVDDDPTDPSLIGADDDDPGDIGDPVQVTDPIDTTDTYFTPGS